MSGDYVCRVCEATDNLEILFKKENENLIEMLTTILDAPVEPDDFLPQCICANCIQRLHQAYKFKIKFLATEEKLRKALEAEEANGEKKEAVSMPEDSCIEEIPIKEEISEPEPEDSNFVSEICVKEELFLEPELETEDTKPEIEKLAIPEEEEEEEAAPTPKKTGRKRKAQDDGEALTEGSAKRGGRAKRATPARGKKAAATKKNAEE